MSSVRLGMWLVSILLAACAPNDPPPPAPVARHTEQLAWDAETPDAGAMPDAAVTPSPPSEPSLAALEANLRALVEGRLPEDTEIEGWFMLPLERLAPIQAQLGALADEIRTFESNLLAVDGRALQLGAELPPPAAPVELASSLPAPPEPPEQPVLASDHEPTPEELAAFEDRKAQHAAYAAELARHAVERTKRADAEAAYQRALAQHRKAQRELKREIEQAAADLRLRLSIARHRQAYLSRLARLLEQMSPPARRSLALLARPRSAVRAHAAELRGLAAAIDALQARVARVADRDAAGALLGFAVDRKKLEQDLRSRAEDLRQTSGLATAAASRTDTVAESLEREGVRIRRIMLQTITSASAQDRIDALFSLHLRELRRLRKQLGERASGSPPVDVSGFERASDALVAEPDAVGTTAEGSRISTDVGKLVEEAGRALAEESATRERWALAFEREVVTVTESTASEEMRAQRYALSAELLDEFRIEARDAWSEVAEWASARRRSLSDWRTRLGSGSSWLVLGRMLVALCVVLGAISVRRRGSAVIARLVHWLVRLPAMRRRARALVRSAGLLETIFPALVTALAGYFVFATLGSQRPEVKLMEIAFRWSMLVVLGKRLLEGLTLRQGRGRPALLEASEVTVQRLRQTYDRMGPMVAFAAIAKELSSSWLGSGLIHRLVAGLLTVWVTGWALWAVITWRAPLARAWAEKAAARPVELRVAGWIERHALGALLVPLPLLALALRALAGFALPFLTRRGLLSYLSARRLRRKARQMEPSFGTSHMLPERYLREFPLYPILEDDGPLVLPRSELVHGIRTQIERWRSTGADGSLVLIGEKGVGKTTLLALLARRIDDLPVWKHTLNRKLITAADLAADLAPSLKAVTPDLEGIIAHLRSGERRVVMIDEAHNLFLRTIDGYRSFEAMIRIVNETSDRVFWLFAFNTFAWQFLNQSVRRVHYFRKLLPLPGWSKEELRELISRRNHRSSMSIEFDDLLLDTSQAGEAGFELIEGSDGYFRLLWEASGGNARVATHLWLESLSVVDENTLRVGLFREPRADAFDAVGDELLFALAALCQHENLSEDELREAINVTPGFAAFAFRYLEEYGLAEPKASSGERLTLSPRYYRQVIHLLRRKHLLFDPK